MGGTGREGFQECEGKGGRKKMGEPGQSGRKLKK